jgi:hypothetical protein
VCFAQNARVLFFKPFKVVFTQPITHIYALKEMNIKIIQKGLIPLFALLPLTILMALTTGCRDESGSQQGDGTPLSVASVTTEAETVVSALTSSGSSALRSTTALTSGSIGVYRVSTTDYAAQSNVQYTYSSGWSSTSPIYLYSATASVCAYYPYSATIEDDPTTSGTVETNGPTAIPLTSQLYSTTSDLSYASSVTPSSASPGVSFAMVHAYAKMTFTITHDASYSGTCAVSGITIANAGIRASNTLNITTGSYGSTTASGSVTVNPAISSIDASASTTATVLIVPTITGTTSETLSDDMTFLFTVDGSTHAATLPVSTNNLTTLAAGSNYQINANISGSGFSVTLGSAAGSGSISMVAESANCYMLLPNASVSIPVSRANEDGTTRLSSLTSDWTCGLLWTDNINGLSSSSVLSNITANYTVGQIQVVAGSAEGNAVVFVKDASGNIAWSWHIWVSNYSPDNGGTTYTVSNGVVTNTWMDRNLGATTATAATSTSAGLHYQWGRKDPFPSSTNYTLNSTTSKPIYSAANTVTSVSLVSATTTISNAIKNPLSFYYGSSDWLSTANSTLWSGASYNVAKSVYDPCPIGWRVSSYYKTSISTSPWVYFLSNSTWLSTDRAWTYSSSNNIWPAAGYRDYITGALTSTGIEGDYWDASEYNQLVFRNSTNNEMVNNHRAYGFSVRCVKNWN